jgi:glucan 1,3-beta-glucosidase
LNEPAGFVSPDVITKYRQFAYDSYGRVRYPTGSNPSDVYLSLHDAFQPLSVWEKSFPSPQFQGVSYSDHPYFVFNENDLRKNDDQRIATICGMKDYYARAQSFNPILLDEFTAATTDCTNFLNGR